jgi:hypothetical protein
VIFFVFVFSFFFFDWNIFTLHIMSVGVEMVVWSGLDVVRFAYFLPWRVTVYKCRRMVIIKAFSAYDEWKRLNGRVSRVSRVSTIPARRSQRCQRVLARRFGGVQKGGNWRIGSSRQGDLALMFFLV